LKQKNYLRKIVEDALVALGVKYKEKMTLDKLVGVLESCSSGPVMGTSEMEVKRAIVELVDALKEGRSEEELLRKLDKLKHKIYVAHFD